MGATIQIRNVPEEIRERLKAKAAAAGMSLSSYLLQDITRLAAVPTSDEARAYFRRRKPAPVAPEEIVSAVRSGRGR